MISNRGNISIRLSGNDIRPDNVSVNELVKLLESFNKALRSINSNGYEIFLTEIQNQSLGLSVIATLTALENAQRIGDAIKKHDVSELPNNAVLELKNIQKFTLKKEATAQFSVNNEPVFRLDGDVDLDLPNDKKTSGYSIEYGSVIRCGGKDPKARIRFNDGNELTIRVSREQAKTLGSRLYVETCFEGEGIWNLSNYELIDFKISDIYSYEDVSNESAFLSLKSIVDDKWLDINDDED